MKYANGILCCNRAVRDACAKDLTGLTAMIFGIPDSGTFTVST